MRAAVGEPVFITHRGGPEFVFPERRPCGFAALDAALAHGPVHLMKRNRPSVVLLSTADYEDLLLKAKRNQSPASHGLSQFLAQDVDAGGLDEEA